MCLRGLKLFGNGTIMRARTGIAVLSVNAMIKHAKTNPRLYEDMVELGYSDSTFPAWWYSPGREGIVVKEAEDGGQDGTTLEEGGENGGKRTQSKGEEAYEPTPPDTPKPRIDRSTRPPLPSSSDPLPPPPPSSDLEMAMLKDQAVTEITTGAHAVWRNKECLLMFTNSF
jgi:hypothetical protein